MHRPVFVAPLLLVALLLTGCTFAAVTPRMVAPPPAKAPTVLVLTDLQIGDELWSSYKVQFRRSVEEWLKRNGGFGAVLTERPPAMGEDGVVLLGTLTEVDKGSTALRWIVGFGAGQAKIKGDFELQSPAGATLARFSASESYLGGAGIGGAGFLDMDDLMRRFSESVAETAVKWARGEKIGDIEK